MKKKTATIILFFWGIFLSIGVYLYVNYANSYYLSTMISEKLNEKNIGKWNIGAVAFEAFPRVKLIISGIDFSSNDNLNEAFELNLKAKEVTLALGWSSILEARFIPGSIIFENMDLNVDLNNMSEFKSNENADKNNENLSDRYSVLINLLKDLRLRFKDSHILIKNNEQNEITTISDINGSIRLPGFFAGSSNLRIGLIDVTKEIINESKQILSLKKTKLNTKYLYLEKNISNSNLLKNIAFLPSGFFDFTSTISMPKFEDLYLNFIADIQHNEASRHIDGKFSAKKSSLIEGHTVPLDVSFDYSSEDFDNFSIKNTLLQLSDNIGEFNGELNLSELELVGKLKVLHLSLPQWFSFARVLPDGVFNTLDQIKGEASFKLNPKKLIVQEANASILGMDFVGTGGVKDFSKPVIYLKAKTTYANVNNVIPELIGKSIEKSNYAYPSLDDYYESDEPQKPIDIGYDIDLYADSADAWRLRGNDFNFRTYSKDSKNYLLFKYNKLYGGNVNVLATLDGDINIHGKANDVNALSFTQAFTRDSVVDGKLNLSVDLNSRLSSWVTFVTGLKGRIEADIVEAKLAQENLDKINIKIDATGKEINSSNMPRQLEFDGKTIINAQAKRYNIDLNLNGKAKFDPKTFAPISMTDVPGKVSFTGFGIKSTFSTKFSYTAQKNLMELADINGDLPGGFISGYAFIDNDELKGHLNGSSTALNQFVNSFTDIKFLPKKSLSFIDFNTDFAIKQNHLNLKNFTGKIDNTSITGYIDYIKNDINTLNVNLRLGTLDINHYINSSSKDGALNYNLLNNISGKGVIQVSDLIVKKIKLSGVYAQYHIANNSLEINPINITPYKGHALGNIKVSGTRNGYMTRLYYNAYGMNMLDFSSSIAKESVIGGSGKISLDLNGLIANTGDIPKALSGNYSFSIDKGYFATLNKNTITDTESFETVSASGVMNKGVLKTNNILLKSNSLNASGYGTINLVDWTLFAKLNASTPSFTDVPVTFSGSLDAPEREVDTIKAIGSGFLNLVGDILTLPFKFLSK